MIEALHAIKRRQSELVAFFLSLESTILSVMLDRTKITYSALWNFGFVLNIVFSINHSTYIIWFLFSECVSRKIFRAHSWYIYRSVKMTLFFSNIGSRLIITNQSVRETSDSLEKRNTQYLWSNISRFVWSSHNIHVKPCILLDKNERSLNTLL